MATPATPQLTPQTLACGVDDLTARDADLAAVVERFGPPPLWAREPGFATLVHIILEQQVSLASARAAFERLLALATPLAPDHFLALDDATLRGIGFSRQKTSYCRALALTIVEGRLDLAKLETMDEDQAFAQLVRLKGIGPWSANIYLLMALRRPDVWPVGDLALLTAARDVKGLDTRPTDAALQQMAEQWRPWRSVAARLLWHHYLSVRE